MDINKIEDLLKVKSGWEPNTNFFSNRTNNIFLKIFSVFSVLFSLSVIKELSSLGIELYLIILFSIFLILLIILNEYIKINKLINIFSFNKTIENILISILTLLVSISISTYGIFKFLDKREDINAKNDLITKTLISDTTNYYNNKIESLKNLKIEDDDIFYPEYNIYINQLEQYTNDRDNYKNDQIRSIRLREYYKEINEKIDDINSKLVLINSKFNQYKINEINKLEKELVKVLNEIDNNKYTIKSNLETRNNIIILIFVLFTLITEFGIVYITKKIGITNIKNNNIIDANKELESKKIKHIKNTEEYKKFELYKNIIIKLFILKNKNNPVTINELKAIIDDENITTNQMDRVITDLRMFGIISEPVRRIGSKIEKDLEESIDILKNYFQPYFDKY